MSSTNNFGIEIPLGILSVQYGNSSIVSVSKTGVLTLKKQKETKRKTVKFKSRDNDL